MTTGPYDTAPVPTPGAGTTAMQTPTALPGRGQIIGGIVSIVVGVVLGIVSLVLLLSGVVSAVGDQLTAPMYQVPGSATMTLDPGSYLIFEDQSGIGFASSAAFRVNGPDGEPLAVDQPAFTYDIGRPEGQFTAVAAFDAAQPGDYQVVAAAVGGTGGRFFVAHDIRGSVGSRGWWGFGIGGGALLVVLGIVLLAVGLTRRSRARAAAATPYDAGGYYAATYAGYQQPYGTSQSQRYGVGQPYGTAQQPYGTTPLPSYGTVAQPYGAPPVPVAPPPGWYPDPARPGGRRYWDGTTWTSHTA